MAQNFNIACSSVFCEYALVLSKQNLGHTGNENVAPLPSNFDNLGQREEGCKEDSESIGVRVESTDLILFTKGRMRAWRKQPPG